uniref:N-acetylneuraminate synthase family protein n=1 Tax=Ningiella ruwaisensis TaxID=2364274 RepID=UPI0010A0AAAE|nr:N-acetylneuraminate synthase family protein [Ningiella ruwaisensis]
MIIERNIARYVVFTDDELSHALRKISTNKTRIVFAVAPNGVLEGVITDGDLRRWLLNSSELDITRPVSDALNKRFVYQHENAPRQEIEALFSKKIEFIPLIDKQQRLVAVASYKQQPIQIDTDIIDADNPVYIIAEIGNNHNGDIHMAYRLVDEAVKAGANCAKFQLRDMCSMYRQAESGVSGEDLGAEYTLDLLARFQLSNDQMFKVFDYCKEKGITPLCTPWDEVSLSVLEEYGMPAYKVASADLTNHEFLLKLAKTGKPLICSTGMSSEAEIKEAIALLNAEGAQFVLLHCNSTYPAPFKDVNLKYLHRLQELMGDGFVGYSGHERGISVAISAVALGARVIEKHFTLDRNMEGNDHRVSLLPAEFAAMTQGIREIENALGTAEIRKITQGEMMNREVLGKSLVANVGIKAGERINESHITSRSPGKGLPPYRKCELIGKIAPRDIQKGDFFYPSDLNSDAIKARPYRFERPYGIPVRYHDFVNIAKKTNLNLVEFHFSYKDLDLSPGDYLDAKGYDMDLVVHSPELFEGDHVMDLCSSDSAYRNRSIAELQRVIQATRELKSYFTRSTTPKIIINAGGFTLDGFMPEDERKIRYALVADALSQLDQNGVEIIPQTMPPYPWHFGGQRFHNLFMDADEIKAFCEAYQTRICLDISHSKLACNLKGQSFSEFIEKVAPYTAHLHIVDAEGVDGEGLQIGDGEIDFKALCNELKIHAPKASFIPEIWQGHKNEGEGFWIALDKLEAFSL